jgi:hypothetical protein
MRHGWGRYLQPGTMSHWMDSDSVRPDSVCLRSNLMDLNDGIRTL